MSEIHIIKHVTLTEDGPVVTDTLSKVTPQLIHLRQGRLDGACGIYCLCMALITLGFEKYTKISNVFSNETSTSEKLFQIIPDNNSALIREGADTKDLLKYLEPYREKGLLYKPISAILHGNDNQRKVHGKKLNHKKVKDFVVEHVLKDHVVLLASQYHWVMVVGLEYTEIIPRLEDAAADPRLFLLLDPDEETPKCSVWNGVIDISQPGKGNRWFGSGNHAFYEALALWKE